MLWIALLITGCRTPALVETLDNDSDGWAAEDDCEDDNSAVHPGQLEVCNGVDDDCDGNVDGEHVIGGEIYFHDGDGDGWGAPATQIIACGQPPGFVRLDGDCNDDDISIHPGAVETCDRVDEDCDGVFDNNAVDAGVWFVDADDDGTGDFAHTVLACEQVLGIVANADDCDDADPTAGRLAAWYEDADNDGFGDAMTMTLACHQPEDRVKDNTDCDDSTGQRHPGAAEVCNWIDDDCDGWVDENALDAAPWFYDYDSDGFGSLQYVIACQIPTGYAVYNSDCDDQDGDVNPHAEEWCDGTDGDCDGVVDNAAVDQVEWFYDADGDGHGDPTRITLACEAPVGWVEDDGDCDDGDPALSAEQLWYLDWTGDGAGDPTMPFLSCHPPPQYVGNAAG